MLLFKLLCIHKYKMWFAKDYFCVFVIQKCKYFFLNNQIAWELFFGLIY